MSDDSNDDKSVASAKSAKTKKAITKIIKSLEKDNHRLQNSVSALQVRCR
jgi:Txe/YoeB family toxin of Txe-Axe toxin-antitoxin module